MATGTSTISNVAAAALRDASLSEEQAEAIYEQGKEAVVFALLALTKKLAEAQGKTDPSITLSTPSGMIPTRLTRIALEGIDDYRVYESIRNALVEGVGARSATPVEAMPGHIVIAVDSGHSGFELLRALERAIPSHLELIPVQIDPQLLRLRVSIREPISFDPEGNLVTPPPAEREPIDTTGRNRY